MTNKKFNRIDIFQEVTDTIIKKLEQGVIPWEKPFKTGCLPQNIVSQTPYSGTNLILLGCNDFSSPYWMTFKQCKKLGGMIKKGERGTIIIFTDTVTIREKNPETGEEEIVDIKRILKYHKVFNLEQTKDIKTENIPEIPVTMLEDPYDLAESVIENMKQKPVITHGQKGAAYYRPSEDSIYLPEKHLFNSINEYYSTAFHELVHSTGHPERLNREGITDQSHFGSEKYSREELVAEIGSAFLCATTGVENVIDNQTAYIQGWLSKLENNKSLFTSASSSAWKASTYIHHTQ